ncbi:MAG TPA: hypothetical protein VMD49_04310 [Steroidobacteraceae bacterium]|nr:hypothetical protein [Steroidobacteraceae bacterium]
MTISRGRSTTGTDVVALGAAACILIGWFGMSTLVTELAGVHLTFHFYNMWSVVANPTRLLTGLGDGDSVRGLLFGVLCLAIGLTVFVPYRLRQRGAWLLYLAPLALMLACGALLYERTATELFADTGRYGAIESQFVTFANKIADSMSRSLAQHITLGLGAYVSFAASLVLAARGVARFRAPAPD